MQSNSASGGLNPKCQKRLLNDLKTLQDKYSEEVDGISAYPQEDNLLLWNAVICGPEETIWEGGVFQILIKFTEEYPNKGPMLFMKTKGVVHPNICPKTGWICLDLFKDQWNAAYDVGAMLIAVRSVLNEPNLKSMANPEAGKLYQQNYNEFVRLAEQAVENSLTD